MRNESSFSSSSSLELAPAAATRADEREPSTRGMTVDDLGAAVEGVLALAPLLLDDVPLPFLARGADDEEEARGGWVPSVTVEAVRRFEATAAAAAVAPSLLLLLPLATEGTALPPSSSVEMARGAAALPLRLGFERELGGGSGDNDVRRRERDGPVSPWSSSDDESRCPTRRRGAAGLPRRLAAGALPSSSSARSVCCRSTVGRAGKAGGALGLGLASSALTSTSSGVSTRGRPRGSRCFSPRARVGVGARAGAGAGPSVSRSRSSEEALSPGKGRYGDFLAWCALVEVAPTCAVGLGLGLALAERELDAAADTEAPTAPSDGSVCLGGCESAPRRGDRVGDELRERDGERTRALPLASCAASRWSCADDVPAARSLSHSGSLVAVAAAALRLDVVAVSPASARRCGSRRATGGGDLSRRSRSRSPSSAAVAAAAALQEVRAGPRWSGEDEVGLGEVTEDGLVASAFAGEWMPTGVRGRGAAEVKWAEEASGAG